MSFRASLLRARVPAAPLARAPLSTFARLPAPSLKAAPALSRSFATSPVSRLQVSQPLRNGGTEEAPHSGINANRSVRMDT
ncbi:hypothetical protein L198_02183 [Cryptococcus wingfieldii CBS 7118]|uniref:Uncharacterized protein n=1 Tax=Cryptococcus wingfieldii CBS 7118 TaxID=1295528 RepID=A0A1E3JR32_9TREE|nr:hypothetical protein L198_02183 [Cryptococcus wingfieldii CBS 7118]ODO03338.1 hypothetical protein L198_02183 [Cryptococcus wingfieldii CBS 7118]